MLTENKFEIEPIQFKKYVPKNKNIAKPKNVEIKKKKKRIPKKEEDIECVNESIEIRIIERQQEEIDNIIKCYNKYPTYLEISTPGSGKTYISLEVARRLGLPVIIVAQSSLLDWWIKVAKNMGVEIEYSISYGKLCGKTQFINNKLLRKRNSGKTIEYEVTEEYIEMLMKGVLLIFDECSMIKNRLAEQTKACRTISRKLTHLFNNNDDFKSRSLFVSGAPITEIIHIVDFIKTIGFINCNKFYEIVKKKGVKQLKFVGIKPLVDLCSQIDKEETDYILSKLNDDQSANNFNKVIVSLYVEILKKEISGGIKSSNIENYKFDIKNKFYEMKKKDFEKIERIMYEMIDHIGYDDEQGIFTKSNIKNKISTIKPFRSKINQAKIAIIFSECERVFNKYQNEKIIIATEYVAGIVDVLKNGLSEYGAEIIDGSVEISERKRIIDLFNEDSAKCKVLILSAAGYRGQNIHDQNGGYRHRMYILPDYSMEKQYQASYRGYREGLKSDFKVRNVFVKNLEIELRIIKSLTRQSCCAKLMLSDNVIQNSIFPDDYENKIQGEKEKVKFEIKNAKEFETYSLSKN